MKYCLFRGCTVIFIIGLLGIVPLAIAETFLDIDPDLITPFSSTTLEICQSSGSQDRLRNLTVTDPSGTVWWYSAAEGAIPWYCPLTYDIPFGSGSSGWTPNDGDSTQTDEEGIYIASVEYIDGNRQIHAFSVNEFTVNLVPEFTLPSIILPTIALGSFALRNRIKQK